MEIKALSATRIESWLTCKYRYGCTYHKFHPEVVRIQPVHFKLGTAVHSALEYAGKLVKDNGLTKFSDQDITDICLVYYRTAAEETLNDLDILNDGLEMLRCKLDNFEFHLPILTLERRFDVTIDGVPVTGAMDRVVEMGPNHIGVVDYKTSKSAKTEAELVNNVQAGIYDIIARHIYKDAKQVTVCLDFLRHGPVTATIPEDKRIANMAMLRSVYDDIRSAKESDLKPSMHEFCAWCDYFEVCPEIKRFQSRVDGFDVNLTDDLDELARIYAEASVLAKGYSLKKEAIGAKLKKALDVKQTSHLKVGDFNISVAHKTYVNYNIADVYRVLGADRLLKCVKVQKAAFEKLALKSGISKEELASMKEVNFSKPIISVRQVKD